MKLDKLLTKLKIYRQKKFPNIYPKTDTSDESPAIPCNIAICNNIVYAKGLCNAHYQRGLRLYKEGIDKSEWHQIMNTPIRKKKRRG